MGKITLQDLTPNIYYKESRDFQFIGRLYDVVLNSVKTNADNLYNLPINDDTDTSLIDLMTLTLGFKSRHNYNVKQLTALCSAFCCIIRDKGNIESIINAARTLLNAEGIDEDIDYTVGDFNTIVTNNTILNLFIPEKLSDINLLRDLLLYILPAGMSCNIIRETRVYDKATTSLTTSDDVMIYEGIYKDEEQRKAIIYTNNNAKSMITPSNYSELSTALAKATPGLFMNGDVYRPQQENPTDIEYNIIYITDGGKITNTADTKYVFKLTDNGVVAPDASKAGYQFNGWKLNDSTTYEAGACIPTDTARDIILTAQWTQTQKENTQEQTQDTQGE